MAEAGEPRVSEAMVVKEGGVWVDGRDAGCLWKWRVIPFPGECPCGGIPGEGAPGGPLEKRKT